MHNFYHSFICMFFIAPQKVIAPNNILSRKEHQATHLPELYDIDIPTYKKK